MNYQPHPTFLLLEEIDRLRAELKAAESFHRVAVKERDYERADNERLREALSIICSAEVMSNSVMAVEQAVKIAREALGETP